MGKYRNLLLNTLLFAANAVATKLVTFVLVPLYTYYMSAGEYGLTDMSLAVISLVTPLATLSIADAALRYIVEDKARAEEYFALSFVVTVLSIAVVGLLTPLLDFSVFGGLGAYKGWFVLAYATSALMNLCGQVARGVGKVGLIPLCAGGSSVVTLVSAWILIGWEGMGVIGYFVSSSLGPIAAVTVYIVAGGLGKLFVRGIRSLLAQKDVTGRARGMLVSMLRYALPLIPNSLFWWVSTSVNRLFVTGALGISASGMFAAASKVPNLLNTAYSIFQQAWQLSAFQESSGEDVKAFYSHVFRVLQAGIAILCAAISLGSPWLASLLLQGETYQAWPMIPILLIANLMSILNSFYGTVYTSTMHTSCIMYTTVVGAVVCIILTPALIPVLGIYGACLASVVGQGTVFVIRAVDSRKFITFDAGWRFLAPTLVMLVVQAILTALQVSWWETASAICLLAVTALQGMQVVSLIRASGGFLTLLKRGGKE